ISTAFGVEVFAIVAFEVLGARAFLVVLAGACAARPSVASNAIVNTILITFYSWQFNFVVTASPICSPSCRRGTPRPSSCSHRLQFLLPTYRRRRSYAPAHPACPIPRQAPSNRAPSPALAGAEQRGRLIRLVRRRWPAYCRRQLPPGLHCGPPTHPDCVPARGRPTRI